MEDHISFTGSEFWIRMGFFSDFAPTHLKQMTKKEENDKYKNIFYRELAEAWTSLHLIESIMWQTYQ